MSNLVYDPPTDFAMLLPLEQQAIRLWARLALAPRRTIGGNCSFSYGLKHDAEEALGWYVGNGALKGAMLAEGYRYRAVDERNWVFNSRQHCPHFMGTIGKRRRCPLEGKYVPTNAWGRFPALCQATPAELAEFDRLRQAAASERATFRTRVREERSRQGDNGL